jgi:hypothetical protein
VSEVGQFRRANPIALLGVHNSPTLLAKLKQIETEISGIENQLKMVSQPQKIALGDIQGFVLSWGKELTKILMGDKKTAKQAIRSYFEPLKMIPNGTDNKRFYTIEGFVKPFLRDKTVMLLAAPQGFELHYRNFSIPISIDVDKPAIFKRPASESRSKLIAKVLQLRTSGMSYPAIGRHLQISPSFACALLSESGNKDPLNRRRSSHERRKKCDASEVLQLRQQGKTFDAIGKELHVSKATARRTFRLFESRK